MKVKNYARRFVAFVMILGLLLPSAGLEAFAAEPPPPDGGEAQVAAAGEAGDAVVTAGAGDVKVVTLEREVQRYSDEYFSEVGGSDAERLKELEKSKHGTGKPKFPDFLIQDIDVLNKDAIDEFLQYSQDEGKGLKEGYGNTEDDISRARITINYTEWERDYDKILGMLENPQKNYVAIMEIVYEKYCYNYQRNSLGITIFDNRPGSALDETSSYVEDALKNIVDRLKAATPDAVKVTYKIVGASESDQAFYSGYALAPVGFVYLLGQEQHAEVILSPKSGLMLANASDIKATFKTGGATTTVPVKPASDGSVYFTVPKDATAKNPLQLEVNLTPKTYQAVYHTRGEEGSDVLKYVPFRYNPAESFKAESVAGLLVDGFPVLYWSTSPNGSAQDRIEGSTGLVRHQTNDIHLYPVTLNSLPKTAEIVYPVMDTSSAGTSYANHPGAEQDTVSSIETLAGGMGRFTVTHHSDMQVDTDNIRVFSTITAEEIDRTSLEIASAGNGVYTLTLPKVPSRVEVPLIPVADRNAIIYKTSDGATLTPSDLPATYTYSAAGIGLKPGAYQFSGDQRYYEGFYRDQNCTEPYQNSAWTTGTQTLYLKQSTQLAHRYGVSFQYPEGYESHPLAIYDTLSSTMVELDRYFDRRNIAADLAGKGDDIANYVILRYTLSEPMDFDLTNFTVSVNGAAPQALSGGLVYIIEPGPTFTLDGGSINYNAGTSTYILLPRVEETEFAQVKIGLKVKEYTIAYDNTNTVVNYTYGPNALPLHGMKETYNARSAPINELWTSRVVGTNTILREIAAWSYGNLDLTLPSRLFARPAYHTTFDMTGLTDSAGNDLAQTVEQNIRSNIHSLDTDGGFELWVSSGPRVRISRVIPVSYEKNGATINVPAAVQNGVQYRGNGIYYIPPIGDFDEISNIQLQYNYTPATYTLGFYDTDSTSPVFTMNYTYGTGLDRLPALLMKDNKLFSGWSESREAGGELIESIPADQDFHGHRKFYAQYEGGTSRDFAIEYEDPSLESVAEAKLSASHSSSNTFDVVVSYNDNLEVKDYTMTVHEGTLPTVTTTVATSKGITTTTYTMVGCALSNLKSFRPLLRGKFYQISYYARSSPEYIDGMPLAYRYSGEDTVLPSGSVTQHGLYPVKGFAGSYYILSTGYSHGGYARVNADGDLAIPARAEGNMRIEADLGNAITLTYDFTGVGASESEAATFRPPFFDQIETRYYVENGARYLWVKKLDLPLELEVTWNGETTTPEDMGDGLRYHLQSSSANTLIACLKYKSKNMNVVYHDTDGTLFTAQDGDYNAAFEIRTMYNAKPDGLPNVPGTFEYGKPTWLPGNEDGPYEPKAGHVLTAWNAIPNWYIHPDGDTVHLWLAENWNNYRLMEEPMVTYTGYNENITVTYVTDENGVRQKDKNGQYLIRITAPRGYKFHHVEFDYLNYAGGSNHVLLSYQNTILESYIDTTVYGILSKIELRSVSTPFNFYYPDISAPDERQLKKTVSAYYSGSWATYSLLEDTVIPGRVMQGWLPAVVDENGTATVDPAWENTTPMADKNLNDYIRRNISTGPENFIAVYKVKSRAYNVSETAADVKEFHDMAVLRLANEDLAAVFANDLALGTLSLDYKIGSGEWMNNQKVPGISLVARPLASGNPGDLAVCGLTPDTTYTLRLRQNGFVGNEVTVTTQKAPTLAYDMSAHASTNLKATVQFDGDAALYREYYSVDMPNLVYVNDDAKPDLPGAVDETGAAPAISFAGVPGADSSEISVMEISALVRGVGSTYTVSDVYRRYAPTPAAYADMAIGVYNARLAVVVSADAQYLGGIEAAYTVIAVDSADGKKVYQYSADGTWAPKDSVTSVVYSGLQAMPLEDGKSLVILPGSDVLLEPDAEYQLKAALYVPAFEGDTKATLATGAMTDLGTFRTLSAADVGLSFYSALGEHLGTAENGEEPLELETNARVIATLEGLSDKTPLRSGEWGLFPAEGDPVTAELTEAQLETLDETGQLELTFPDDLEEGVAYRTSLKLGYDDPLTAEFDRMNEAWPTTHAPGAYVKLSQPDYSKGLKAAIEAAEALRAATLEEEDGDTVDVGAAWASPTAHAAYKAAIDTANGLAKPDITREAAAAALAALNDATAAFEDAISYGRKLPALPGAALASGIAEARKARTSALVSENGSDVPPDKYWVTSATMAALDTAIDTAVDTLLAGGTQTALDSAAATLAQAVTNFTGTRALGTSADTDHDALVASAYDKLSGIIALRDDTATSADGYDVPSDKKWVTQAVMDALEDVLSDILANIAANPAYDFTAMLDSARQAFEAARKDGLYSGTLDVSALGAALAEARQLLRDTIVSPNGKNVSARDLWAPKADHNALAAAADAAADALKTVFTPQQVNTATTALNTAIETFKAAQKPGLSIVAIELEGYIGEALLALHDTAISANGKDVPEGSFWVTLDERELLEAAVEAAQAARRSATTQAELDDAAAGIEAALARFKAAMKEGTSKEAAVPVTRVVLSADSLELTRGESVGLNTTVYPAGATNKKLTWSIESSTPDNVLEISGTGASGRTITAKNVGTATVRVTTDDGGLTADCVVTVGVAAESVTVSPETLRLAPGQSSSPYNNVLMATVLPEEAPQQVEWHSSNPGVATVALVNGVPIITGVAPGAADIIATTPGGLQDACRVTVAWPGGTLSLSQSELLLPVGKAARVTVTPSSPDIETLEEPLVLNPATGGAFPGDEEPVGVKFDSTEYIITGQREGAAIVRFTSSANTRVHVDCLVEVYAPADPADKTVKYALRRLDSATVTAYTRKADAAATLPLMMDGEGVKWSLGDAEFTFVQTGRTTDYETLNKAFLIKPDGEYGLKLVENTAEGGGYAALGKKTSFTAEIGVSLGGTPREGLIPGKLTVKVNKSLPKLTLKSIGINSLYADRTAQVVVDGAQSVKLEAVADKTAKGKSNENMDAWMTYAPGTDGAPGSVTIDSAGTKRSGTYHFTATLDPAEWRDAEPVVLGLKVTSTYTTPALKLNSTRANLYADPKLSGGAALTLTPKKAAETLAGLEVDGLYVIQRNKDKPYHPVDNPDGGLTEAEEKTYARQKLYTVAGFNKATGTFTLKTVDGDTPPVNGKVLLGVSVNGGDMLVRLPVNVSVVNATKAISLKASAKSITLNPTLAAADSCKLTITPSVADYRADFRQLDYRLLEKGKPVAEEVLSIRRVNGTFTITTLGDKTPTGKTYVLEITKRGLYSVNGTPKHATVKVTIKTPKPSKRGQTVVEPTATLKATGALDLTTGKPATLTASFKNYTAGGFVGEVNFSVSTSRNVAMPDHPFKFVPVGSAGTQWSVMLEAGKSAAPGTYKVSLTGDTKGAAGLVTRAISFKVIASKPAVALNTGTVTLYKNNPSRGAALQITLPDTCPPLREVTIAGSAKNKFTITPSDASPGFYTLHLQGDPAKAKGATLTLNLHLENNDGPKAVTTVKVKVLVK